MILYFNAFKNYFDVSNACNSSASDSRKEIVCTTNFSKLSQKKHKKIIIILVNILLHVCFILFLKCKNSQESRTQSMLMSSKQSWFTCSCSYTKGAVGRVTFTFRTTCPKASKLAYLAPPGQLCGFCSERFPLLLGAWDGLRYFTVALPGPSI